MFCSFSSTSSTTSKAFTLIELLIVVGIIGILSGVVIAVINPQKQRTKANIAVDYANISKIVSALEAYKNIKGDYPLSDSSGVADFGPYVSGAVSISSAEGALDITVNDYSYEYKYVGGGNTALLTSSFGNAKGTMGCWQSDVGKIAVVECEDSCDSSDQSACINRL